MQYGTHIPGKHYVAPARKHKVGQTYDSPERYGVLHETLTRARKAARSGDAIVRKADSVVVGVRHG